MSVGVFSGGNFINSLQAAGKNAIINGAFDIWQRGTSFSTGSHPSPFFIADRWQATRSGAVAGATISRQASGAPTGFQYYVRLQRDSGNTNTSAINLAQNIETIISIPYANQTITLSFYARAGATYNSAANNVNVAIVTGTGTDQNAFSAAYTGSATPLNTTASATTSWQRFSYTITLASTVTEFQPLIYTQHSGTAGATDYIDVTGVQIELGSTATTFSRAGGTIQGELAACQRYYYRQNGTNNTPFGFGMAASTTSFRLSLPYKQPMRVSPSSIDFSGLQVVDTVSGYAVSNLVITAAGTDFADLTATSTGMTAQRAGWINGSGTCYIGLSAEL